MMDLPGTHSIVDGALDEARQTLFSAADVPLASAEELVAIVTAASVRAMLEARIDQVVKHGHTPEQDANLPLKILPCHARSSIVDTLDLLDRGPRQNLHVARRRLAKAGAILLAAIDRIDVELGKAAE